MDKEVAIQHMVDGIVKKYGNPINDINACEFLTSLNSIFCKESISTHSERLANGEPIITEEKYQEILLKDIIPRYKKLVPEDGSFETEQFPTEFIN